MKLRKWQNECVELALNHYQVINKHFLCLATPAAGKTIMAAEVAAQLFEQDRIDFILCFAPSITVSQSISYTFSKRFDARFDGVIGAVGCSYTYQSILFFHENFWQLLKSHRVMVIFDEIHHCAGSDLDNSNAWGEQIIQNVQQQAEYTLALTGTPWRSDKMPIVLANYSSQHQYIQCDYSYGLKEAVRDGVCRSPKLVLIDNEKLVVTDEEKEQKTFASFNELLKDSEVSYHSVITNQEVMHHILERGCKKLLEIRRSNINAAGLVVASSVAHATRIITMLSNDFNQSAVLVTYKQAQPSGIINQFRNASTQWIVSVGMVSEGTDIPRLQVCCHLSRVKTELYFRQVLGRILRVTPAQNQDAWLYTFAEPTLSKFAHRIEQDLPDDNVVINEHFPALTVGTTNSASRKSLIGEAEFEWGELMEKEETCSSQIEPNITSSTGSSLRTLEILGLFRERVIATFDSPF